MQVVEGKNCFFISNFFSPQVSVGFTRNSLRGSLPQDIYKALSPFNNNFEVSYLNQVHSSKVISVNEQGLYEADALFTEKSKLALIVRTADCLPLFFESVSLGLIGLVHMGWRSAKEGILNNLTYKLSSFKVIAGVGLRQCCYEVGEDFLSYNSLKNFIKKRQDKLYFEVVEFAKEELIERGLKRENFLDLNICSFCSDKKFFSYRRDKTQSRTLSFILKT